MFKHFKRTGLFAVIISILITMSGCSDTASMVCDALSEKYGDFFVAVKKGDRIDTNHTKLYIHPEGQEDLLFTATINKKNGIVEDDYVSQLVNYEVERIVKKQFKKISMDTYAQSMVVMRNPLDVTFEEYTPKSFQEKYKFEHYTIYLAVEQENFSLEKAQQALKNANKEIGVNLVVVGFVFDSAKFDKCVEEMKGNPEMSVTLIEKYMPVKSFDVIVENEDVR